MRKRLLHFAPAVAMVCVVLAPALIWSGQRPQPTNEPANVDQDVFKGPPVFTVGPPMTPEELAAREQEKLLWILDAQNRARENLTAAGRFHTLAAQDPSENVVFPKAGDFSSTEHPSLTPAELEKLAAIRNGSLQPRQDRGMWAPKEEPRPLKYDAPLRPLGFEGLTPEERAKLDASRARDKEASGDEGGRSR